MNVAVIGAAACKSRTTSTAHTRAKQRRGGVLPQVPWRSSGDECLRRRSWCWKPLYGAHDLSWTRTQPEPGRPPLTTGCARHGHATPRTRYTWRCLRCQGHSQPPKASWVLAFDGRTSIRAPGQRSPASCPSPARSRTRGGASVVVRARESRVQGEGRQ